MRRARHDEGIDRREQRRAAERPTGPKEPRGIIAHLSIPFKAATLISRIMALLTGVQTYQRHISMSRIRSACCYTLLWALAAIAGVARAQDIEPRAFSNAPIGMNFLIAGYAVTHGSIPTGSLPITDPHIHTDNAIVAYARVFEVFGQSGKFDAIVPYTWLDGSAMHLGQQVEREIAGFADPRYRVSVNLYGAPALSVKEFAAYQQDLIVGVSLAVTTPWSQYDPVRVINIGTNRWSFKPEIGVSKALGPWTVEFAANATFYTDNTDFVNGNTRSQRPLYGAQGHLIYGFDSGVWTSLDATYFTGGRSTVNGVLNADLQQNWRIGGTLAFPIDRSNSIKLYASSGVSARTGNNYDLFGIAWQYRWGAGF
jgi:hypothetical protein